MSDKTASSMMSALVFLLTALVGSVFVLLLSSAGTYALVVYSFAAVWASVWLGVRCGPAIWDYDRDEQAQKVISVKFALVMSVIALIPPANAIVSGGKEAIYMRHAGRSAQAFAIKHFDQIDTDRDGVLTYSELRAAESLRLSQNQIELLSILRRYLPRAGHVIRSYLVYKNVSVGSGKTSRLEKRWVTQSDYGYSRDDLKYLVRIIDGRHQQWW